MDGVNMTSIIEKVTTSIIEKVTTSIIEKVTTSIIEKNDLYGSYFFILTRNNYFK
jgi:hypothetical protein